MDRSRPDHMYQENPIAFSGARDRDRVASRPRQILHHFTHTTDMDIAVEDIDI